MKVHADAQMARHYLLIVFAVITALFGAATARAAQRDFAYVVDEKLGSPEGGLVVFDLETGELIDTVNVGDDPWDVALNSAGTRAYVLNTGGIAPPGRSSVSVIDTTTLPMAVVATITFSHTGTGYLALTPDDSRLYVTGFGGGVFRRGIHVIDTALNAEVDTVRSLPPIDVDVPVNPVGIDITPDGRRAYVTAYPREAGGVGGGGVWEIDIDPGTVEDPNPAYHTVVGAIPDGGDPGIGPGPQGIFVVDTDRAYTTSDFAPSVAEIDIQTNTVIDDLLRDTTGPTNMAVTLDGRRAYVPFFARGPVQVIDIDPTSPDYNEVVDTVPSDDVSSFGIDISSDGKTAAVTEYAPVSGLDVIDIDPSSPDYNSVVDTYTEGLEYPAAVAVAPSALGGGEDPDPGEDLPDPREHEPPGLIAGEGSDAGGSEPPASTEQEAGGAGAACRAALGGPVPSVSHWRGRGDVRLRIKGPPGGYLPVPDGRGRFRLEVRGVGGRRAAVARKVVFYVDGKRRRVDLTPPYEIALEASELEAGYHKLKVVAYLRGGLKRDVERSFSVSDCAMEAFSVGLSSKLRRAHPNLWLGARTFHSALKSVKFRLSSRLRWISRERLAGRKIGEIVLYEGTGRVLTRDLRLPGKRRGYLLKGKMARVRLDERARTLTVTGLNRGIRRIELFIQGKRHRLIKNPGSCSRPHVFQVDLRLEGGSELTLERSLVMCKQSY